MIHSLFCLSNTKLCGGSTVLLEFITRLRKQGQSVDVFVWDTYDNADWFPEKISLVEATTLEEAVSKKDYDFVYFGNAFLVPLALPHITKAIPVLICQAYESFCGGSDYADSVKESPAFAAVVQLPIAVISISKSIQKLLKERLGKDSMYVSAGINDAFGGPSWSLAKDDDSPKRVLMVGDYLLPLKGMADGFAAIDRLSRDFAVELVLVTQENRNRRIFKPYKFPIEFHWRVENSKISQIYASCHLFCCTSWYEGLGLPAIEAFATGIPVVSTRTYGVFDYGVDGENLLLVEPGNADDLYEKLKLLLSDYDLRDKLRKNAAQTAEVYSWNKAIEMFVQSQIDMKREFKAVAVSASEIKAIVDLMVAERMYLSLEKLRAFYQFRDAVDDVCGRLKNRLTSIEEGVRELQVLKQNLQEFDMASGSQLNKAVYDLCRLLIALKDDEHFLDYLEMS